MTETPAPYTPSLHREQGLRAEVERLRYDLEALRAEVARLRRMPSEDEAAVYLRRMK